MNLRQQIDQELGIKNKEEVKSLNEVSSLDILEGNDVGRGVDKAYANSLANVVNEQINYLTALQKMSYQDNFPTQKQLEQDNIYVDSVKEFLIEKSIDFYDAIITLKPWIFSDTVGEKTFEELKNTSIKGLNYNQKELQEVVANDNLNYVSNESKHFGTIDMNSKTLRTVMDRLNKGSKKISFGNIPSEAYPDMRYMKFMRHGPIELK